jgi:hypothetical protein
VATLPSGFTQTKPPRAAEAQKQTYLSHAPIDLKLTKQSQIIEENPQDY